MKLLNSIILISVFTVSHINVDAATNMCLNVNLGKISYLSNEAKQNPCHHSYLQCHALGT